MGSRSCLLDWLKDEVVTLSSLAEASGLSMQAVSAIVHGKSRAKYENAQKLSAATGGDITVNQICEIKLITKTGPKPKPKRRAA